MEHLSLEIFDLTGSGSQYAFLEDNASISLTDTSELFADGDVWSHNFKLNAMANSHIFGSAAEMHGTRLHDQLHKRRARLWVEGLPLFLGYLRFDGEAEVDEDGNVEVKFESGQKTFDDLIDGAKANQVPMMSDVQIGMALWRKRKVQFGVALQPKLTLGRERKDWRWTVDDEITTSGMTGNYLQIYEDGEKDINSVQQYPRMVFPKGDFYGISDYEHKDFLNTDWPYSDDHPYCNVALCYQKSGYERTDTNGKTKTDYSQEPEAQRGYEVMPANRVNSAPNFYVIYWLRCLMKHLGIVIDENQMMDVQDLRRLFFVNTNCAYEEPDYLREKGYSSRYGRYRSLSGTDWDKGKTGLVPEYFDDKPVVRYANDDDGKRASGFTCTKLTFGEPTVESHWTPPSIDDVAGLTVTVKEVKPWKFDDVDFLSAYKTNNDYFINAYATSDCFPNVDISDVIKAIESGFGVRLLFSSDYKRVRIVLLRNIFRNQEVQDITCDITGETKTENNIRGFRMTYGNTDDTHFFYKGFDDLLPKKAELWKDDSDKYDYSKWKLNAEYGTIIHKVSAFDKTCYVTPKNGNAWGIKVDKDAKRIDELHPSLYEYAGFMDAQDGDCSGDEDTIEEISLNFMPAIMNDCNYENERDGTMGQRFALFVDATMRPRRPDLNDLPDSGNADSPKSYDDADARYDTVKMYNLYGPHGTSRIMTNGGYVKPGEFTFTSDLYISPRTISGRIVAYDGAGDYVRWPFTAEVEGHIYEGYRLYLQDNFEPNDDGVSPIEAHDWGLTLGIMRGSGSDAAIEYSTDPDDGEGNDTWELTPGSSATAHHDTCDSYGNEWDYNGQEIITQSNAQQTLYDLFPKSNAYFQVAGRGYVIDATRRDITDGYGVTSSVLMVYKYSQEQAHPSWYRDYAKWLNKKLQDKDNPLHIESVYQLDLGGNGTLSNVIVEINTTPERAQTMLQLCTLAYSGKWNNPIRIDNGVGSRFGRFSLKLRAEKPNPYFPALSTTIVTTKAQAATAMTTLFKTSNANLLTRPKVSGATMRAAGWDVDADSYATIYSMGFGVEYKDGTVHEILWTPIKQNGTVKTPTQIREYVSGFEGLLASEIASHDTEKLILDIDTTETRANILHQLQEVYYADGEPTTSVSLEPLRYLTITNPNLRGRGLADQFYKEYSYFIRNARIAKMKVRMELAQLLAIDKTKQVKVGDVQGFIRKMEYTVSNDSGLGLVTMEIMYI